MPKLGRVVTNTGQFAYVQQAAQIHWIDFSILQVNDSRNPSDEQIIMSRLFPFLIAWIGSWFGTLLLL